MNNFELEIFNDEGSGCTLYTVRWEGAQRNETEKFLLKFREHGRLKRRLQELVQFLEVIIAEEGALDEYFRFENTAQALPPGGEHIIGELTLDMRDFPLRLYCLRLSDSLLILFNGDEKTSQTAQEGKTSMVFREANQFAGRILSALQDKTIHVSDNDRELRYYDGSVEIIL